MRAVEAGWAWNPDMQHDYRYWDGHAWTDRVAVEGREYRSPRLPTDTPFLTLPEPPDQPLFRAEWPSNVRSPYYSVFVGPGFCVLVLPHQHGGWPTWKLTPREYYFERRSRRELSVIDGTGSAVAGAWLPRRSKFTSTVAALRRAGFTVDGP